MASATTALKNLTVWELYPNIGASGLQVQDLPPTQPSTDSQSVCGLLWFYHIPKCGGTAVGDWLNRMQAEKYIDAVLPLMSMSDVIDYTSFYSEELAPFLSNPTGKIVAVHHHHRGPGLYKFDDKFEDLKVTLKAAGCKLIRATFLRHPVEREVSALFYNHGDISGKEQRDTFESILSNVSLAEYHNGQIRYILNNKLDEHGAEFFKFDQNSVSHESWSSALTEANNILNEFELVGIAERLSEGVAQLANLIGKPDAIHKVPLQIVNQHEHPAQALPDNLSDAVAEACRYDQTLHDEWKSKWIESEIG